MWTQKVYIVVWFNKCKVVEEQKQLFKEKIKKADPSIKKRVLKLGDPRIPKEWHEFYKLCFQHLPAKIYISREHFDYLMEDFHKETYEIFGKPLNHSNEFSLLLKKEEDKYIYINTEVIIKWKDQIEEIYS